MFLNASGKVLFRAITTPGSITGVWLADPAADTVTLLARTDALADVTVDGAQEKIIDLILAGGIDTAGSPQDGRSSPLGDDGKFAILAQFLDGHLAVLTNAAGSGGGGSTGSVTPTSIALGSTIDVTGSGFGGGAARFRAPKAWLTVGTDPRKIPLRVDAKSATDAALHLTLASLRKGAHGPATLHIRPRPRQAAEITADVTIELPAVESLSAPSGQGGDTLTLSGSWFGTKKRKARFVATIGERVVKKTLTVKSWAAGSIVVLVPKRVIPTGAPSLDGTIEVQSDAGVSNTTAFTILR
jgi:hypothetical protein